MPELAELKFTSDYVNKMSEGYLFTKVEKNPIHKCLDINAPYFEDKEFSISSKSRGKELVLTMQHDSVQLPIQMTMGMTGYFRLHETGNEPKHAHLKFLRSDGMSLCFIDVRRFGKWKQGSIWNTDRGPDPTTEFAAFKENILSNIHKAAFKQPIYLLLMNQKYFNGIGNYLRAEIFHFRDQMCGRPTCLRIVRSYLTGRELLRECGFMRMDVTWPYYRVCLMK